MIGQETNDKTRASPFITVANYKYNSTYIITFVQADSTLAALLWGLSGAEGPSQPFHSCLEVMANFVEPNCVSHTACHHRPLHSAYLHEF